MYKIHTYLFYIHTIPRAIKSDSVNLLILRLIKYPLIALLTFLTYA